MVFVRAKLHASLDLRNIERLPLAQRLRANAALDVDKPAEWLADHFAASMDTFQSTDIPVLLPILHANLEAHPPEPSVLEKLCDSSGEKTEKTTIDTLLLRPTLAVRFLYIIARDIPPPAMQTLWPLAWRWIVFIRNYRECLPFEDVWQLEANVPHAALVLLLVPSLRSEKQCFLKELIATPGLMTSFFAAWCYRCRPDHDLATPLAEELFDDGVFECLGYIVDLSESGALRLDTAAIVDEVGGGHMLAAMFTYTMYSVIPDRPQTQLSRFKLLLRLINVLSPEADGHTPLWNHLLEAGITVALVARLHACLPELDRDGRCFAFGFVIRMLAYSTNPSWIAHSIDTGLFLIIAAAMTQPRPFDMRTPGWFTFLSRSLLHRIVVGSTRRALPDLCGILREEQRADPPPAWEPLVRFITLFTERDAILQRLRAQESVCANAMCTAEPPKKKFKLKRCGRCYETAYCSIPCQRADWHSRHRETCLGPGNTAIRAPPSDTLALQLRIIVRPTHEENPPPDPPSGTPSVRTLMHGPNAPFLRAAIARDVQHARNQLAGTSAAEDDSLHVVVDYTTKFGRATTTVLHRVLCGGVRPGETVVVFGLGQYKARCEIVLDFDEWVDIVE
ncbi:MYND-type domain-containing protein [Mycena kentingensis (nom. inval.)]|nr:MYND-type domain-containing protein [Mycena kentingensis (nom. inval.)]